MSTAPPVIAQNGASGLNNLLWRAAGELTGNNFVGTNELAPNQVQNNASIAGGWQPYALTNSKNTIAVPLGAVGFVIQAPSTNTQTLKYADNNSDGGSSIARAGQPSGPIWFDLTTGAPANIYLTANGSVTVEIAWL